MKAAQDRQKSCADIRRKELQFVVGDKIYLKVSFIKGAVRFGSTGKLKPKYIGSFDIIAQISDFAYEALLANLDGAYNFHVSMLKKYVRDER